MQIHLQFLEPIPSFFQRRKGSFVQLSHHPAILPHGPLVAIAKRHSEMMKSKKLMAFRKHLISLRPFAGELYQIAARRSLARGRRNFVVFASRCQAEPCPE